MFAVHLLSIKKLTGFVTFYHRSFNYLKRS